MLSKKEINHLIKEIYLATKTVKIATSLFEGNFKYKSFNKIIKEILIYNNLIENSLKRLKSLFKLRKSSHVKLLLNTNVFILDMINLFNTAINSIEAINKRLNVLYNNQVILNKKNILKDVINDLFKRIKKLKKMLLFAKYEESSGNKINIDNYECRGDFDEKVEECSNCPVKKDCIEFIPFFKKAKELKIDISVRLVEDIKIDVSDKTRLRVIKVLNEIDKKIDKNETLLKQNCTLLKIMKRL